MDTTEKLDAGALRLKRIKDRLDRPEVMAKFWSKVDRPGAAACWLWLAGVDGDDYGCFYAGNYVYEKSHRIAAYYGSGVLGLVARHTCDNPRCCNPDHLKWGTKKDNSRDAIERGRTLAGTRNHNAVLTEDIIIKAKGLRQSGLKWKKIGELLGFNWITVWHACKFGWRHVAKNNP